MLTKEDMEQVEACILQRILEKQELIRTTDKALGEQAFPWLEHPIMKIQRLKGKGGQQPQQIRLTDLMNLCEALGLSWVDVGREALKEVKAAKKKNPA